jgi:serine/threonine-protein kinase
VPLGPGSRIASYEIGARIGAGGMGEVYRAIDTRLGRAVAIKVLPDAVALTQDRLARFDREARMLAALNHPNIAAIYGVEESEPDPSSGPGEAPSRALIMELVEGPTLADRIAVGPVPVDEALAIARQIADALEAAHEQGIGHRDLKPANIKVRPDGTVKVLDFGLARAMEPPGEISPGTTQSPTITTPAVTQGGLILGTAAYMSPEQARGRPVDRRADVWAFAVVLYEMLSGRRAFEAEDVSLTLARVLEREVDLDALPSDVPPRVKRALGVCLLKDPRQRASAMHDVRLALDGAFDAGGEPATSTAGRPLQYWQRPLPAAGLAVLLVALTALAVWRLTPEPTARLARFVAVTAADGFTPTIAKDVAISPAGTPVVYHAGEDGEARISARSLERLEATVLFRTDRQVGSPFLSPDGAWVGFATSEDQTWRRVSVNGGPSLTLFAFPSLAAPLGASWGPDGTIIFAHAGTGLLRGAAEGGGEPDVLTTLDDAQGEIGHRWPEFLPGGTAILFTIARGEGASNMDIAVLDLATDDRKVLLRGGSNPQYSPTGHIVYGVDSTLRAVPFDLGRLEVVGDPVPVLDSVMTDQTGAVEFDLAADGSLVYVPGSGSDVALRRGQLVWRSRGGEVEAITEEPLAGPRYLRLSPDGRRLALTTGRGSDGDLWIYPLDGRPPAPLTFEAHNRHPVWDPAGTQVAFTSTRAGTPSLFLIPADGSTLEPAPLLPAAGPRTAGDWSPDGGELLFSEEGRDTRVDILGVSPDGGEPRLVVATPSVEREPRISPDGRWLAYVSNVSGSVEVWVRAYPGPGAPVRVSPGGGWEPAWARDGRELFYLEGAPGDPGVRMMGVTVETDGDFRAGPPQVVVDGGFVTYVEASGFYDVAPDGRFVMIEAAGNEQDDEALPQEIILIQNWMRELARLVPTD